MRVTVKKMIYSDYVALVHSLGQSAKFTEVPSTNGFGGFKGVYTDVFRHTAAVAWPIDRPIEHQEEFATKYNTGFPVEEYESTKEPMDV